ncbi:MAG: ABC transporter permease [Ruminococcaceae bacterium]|nr:ABC transporter permease [Oscillospiraceae bacterium]
MSIFKPKEQGVSSERALWLRNKKRTDSLVLITKIGILALFLILWEVCANTGIIDSFIMSSPSRIWAVIADLYTSGEFFVHIGVTTYEAVMGFLWGTVLGTVIAALLWLSPFLCRVLEPYLVVLGSLPKIALGPIFIVWIGAGTKAIIVITITISLIVTIMEVLNGFMSTDEDKIKLVRTFGGNKYHIFTKVVLPSNFRTIISSLKISVSMSWVGVIVGEFLVSRAGLGYLIVYGSQVFQLDLVMANVFILGLLATFMYLFIVWIESILFKNQNE